MQWPRLESAGRHVDAGTPACERCRTARRKGFQAPLSLGRSEGRQLLRGRALRQARPKRRSPCCGPDPGAGLGGCLRMRQSRPLGWGPCDPNAGGPGSCWQQEARPLHLRLAWLCWNHGPCPGPSGPLTDRGSRRPRHRAQEAG